MKTGVYYNVVEKRPDFSKAACIGAPWEVFFPTYNQEGNGRKVTKKQMAAAREYCAVCPVSEQCLEYGCRTDSVGIWGGVFLSEHITRKLRRKYGWALQREVVSDS